MKSWQLILFGILIGLLAGGLVFLISNPDPGVPITLLPAPTATNTNPPKPTPTVSLIHVQIKGAILKPGVYEIDPTSRLGELIALAGGTNAEADEKRINHALSLRDGDYVFIPMIGEEIPETARNTPIQVIDDIGVDFPINLNTASLEELVALPGIGPAKAADIIAYREEVGPFLSIEDLNNVEGIGEATVALLREFLIIEE